MRKSAERFKAMIENSTDVIAVMDRQGKVLYASPASERVTGFTPKELKTMDLQTRLSDDNTEEVKQFYTDVLQTQAKAKTLVHKFLNKQGEWLWIENTLTNLLHHSSVKGVVSNFRDVTETLFIEKQKDDFIGIATHELKTPVTSIKAYAQILLSRFRKDGNDSAANLVDKMDGQLNKLISLIGDLLDVTRIEGDRLPLNEGVYEFNDLVKETTEELQRTTDNHKIILHIGNGVDVYGDRERIGQVLNNLITNAIKYSPASIDIKVSTITDSSTITVSVEDKGVGIPTEKQDKVFERFFRVSGPENQSFPGLGLGLYISHEIIKRQGGKIWVESEKGKGSTFCFSLPIDYRQQPNSINNIAATITSF
jgi:PAS domain S-box-containing protein